MTTQPPITSRLRQQRADTRSQSLAEFCMILPIFLTLMCGVFDYGYMIGSSHVMAMAAREAANTSARQDTDPLLRGLSAAVDAGRPRIHLDDWRGGVVITRVTRNATNNLFAYVDTPVTNNCVSTGLVFGSAEALKNRSAILTSSNWMAPTRTLPFGVTNLAVGQEMNVVEIYLTNSLVTPIGSLMHSSFIVPSILYDAAYF